MNSFLRIAFTVVLTMGGSLLALDHAYAQPAGREVEPSPPTRLARQLGKLEERSFAAWKAGDQRALAALVSDRFVGSGPTGRVDKRAALPILSGAACKIASYRLMNVQVTQLTPNVAVTTNRSEVNGICHGKPLVPAYYSFTVYLREAGAWKIAYRAQSAIVDPMKATQPAGSEQWSSGPSATDANTQMLLSHERAVINAWKDHDTARMSELFGSSIQFVDIFGDHTGTHAEALKKWSAGGCDVQSFDLAGAKATMFAPDFGVITYRGSFDGKCFGQTIWPIWGTALYVKRGESWLWSSGINVLAGAGTM